MTTPFLQLHREDADVLRRELAAGLLAPRASIAPKFLYDALGSRLFEAITELDEYTSTRDERVVLDRHAAAIADAAGPVHTLVDLGAGNCAKAARLFPQLRPRRYVAVDISVDFVRDALESLRQRFPTIAMLGVGLDFSGGLLLPDAVGDDPRLFFYPGSSLGNFAPAAALDFLRGLQVACRGGGVLLGVDLVKPDDELRRAYDDALQVTAGFNRNLVRRVRTLLGADARVEDVAHQVRVEREPMRVEMHLAFVRDAVWRWPGGERRFVRGETIHTESAHKYTVAEASAMLRNAGFASVRHWTDDARRFAVMLGRA